MRALDADADARRYEESLPRSARREAGSYFTPPAVARALARRTLEGLERGVVLDPACGAGALLAAASEVVPEAVALVGVDIDRDAVALARERLRGRANVTILEGDALALELPEADAVIANPPFVATYARGAKKLAAARRAFLARRFPELRAGERNLFLHFLALARESVGHEGRIGFVVPDAFLTNERYERARRALLEGSRLEALVLDWPAFGRASVRAALLVARRAESASLAVSVFPDESALEAGRASSREELALAHVAERPAFAFPRGKTDAALERKIRARGAPLGELCWVRDGINPGPRAFREEIVRPLEARREGAHPCLEGKDVSPFRLAAPRLSVLTDSKLLTPDLKRRGASFREAWIFDSEKLVSRQTAPTLVFARDASRARLLNSAHATGRLEGTEESLLWFLALLNSSVLRWYYQRSSGETRRVFPQVHVSALRRLPVPRAGSEHDALVAIARRLEAAPDDRGALEELDERVCELFDLGSRDRRTVGGQGRGRGQGRGGIC